LHFRGSPFNLKVPFQMARMPDEKKPDPFKPLQPSIPGVSPSDGKAKPEAPPPPELPGAPQESARPPIKLIAIAGGGAFVIFVALLFWIRSSLPKSSSAPADTPTATAPAVASKPAGSLPVGPGPIATTEELAKPWSAKRFLYRSLLTGQTEPAMVVRLPHGELWGFSLLEPFGNCELEFVTDLDKLRTEYRYRADHPMVVDPCNRTVYDLSRYGGGAANDELVRGVIVQGTGIRPPMAIEIRVDGKDVVAAREE
jgi:hypothetical protein